MAVVTFYHYTSKEGLDAILDSGYIRESPLSGNHAHFGEGVYGTSLHPHEGHKRIAHNNWGHEYPVRVERAIELKIPKEDVERVKGDRDILVHSGPIQLSDFKWKVWHITQSDDEDDDDDYGDGADDYFDDDAPNNDDDDDNDGNDDYVDINPLDDDDFDEGDGNDDIYDHDLQEENNDDGDDVPEDDDDRHDDTSDHDCGIVDDVADKGNRGHKNDADWEDDNWGRVDDNDQASLDECSGYYEDYDDGSYFVGDCEDNEWGDENRYNDDDVGEDDYYCD